MSIESELEKGNFVVGECIKCKKIVWPPSKYCNLCLGETIPKKISNTGKILEFSKQEETYFCLAEFNGGIKIIGKVIGETPKINQSILMRKCGIEENSYYFEFKLI